MDLHRIRPVFGSGRDGLKLSRLGVVADAQTQAQRTEVVLQQRFLLGCGALVHAVQRRVLVGCDEVGRADIGRQHGFFDQLVGFIAGARNDLFNAPVVIANNLRLGGFEVHRAALGTLFQQRAVNVVQVDQIADAVFAALRFGPACVGQNRCHFGVSEARMRANDRGEKLVGRDLAVGSDQHVTHHRQTVLVWVQ